MKRSYRQPQIGPRLTSKQARSLGIKWCPACATWKRISGGFRELPSGRADGYCLECRRQQAKDRYWSMPVERRRSRSRAQYERVKADPVAYQALLDRGRVAAKAREATEHGRALATARQQRYRQRVYADPARHEARKANRREWYAQRGGRDLVEASRARQAMRRHIAQMLVDVLRQELDKRERTARARREQKRASLERLRGRWLAGEFDDIEPVKVNGELVRLPAVPLGRWLLAQPRSVDAIAHEAEMQPRALFRYVHGETAMVTIEVVDALVTRLDVCMHEIYPPDRYPSIYEVDPAYVE